jgi:hypothetical protein
MTVHEDRDIDRTDITNQGGARFVRFCVQLFGPSASFSGSAAARSVVRLLFFLQQLAER